MKKLILAVTSGAALADESKPDHELSFNAAVPPYNRRNFAVADFCLAASAIRRGIDAYPLRLIPSAPRAHDAIVGQESDPGLESASLP